MSEGAKGDHCAVGASVVRDFPHKPWDALRRWNESTNGFPAVAGMTTTTRAGVCNQQTSRTKLSIPSKLDQPDFMDQEKDEHERDEPETDELGSESRTDEQRSG